jgi:hypothetical protein
MRGRGYYVLNGKTPQPVGDVLQWARWMEDAHRHVAKQTFGHEAIGTVDVSTVFLGLDHSWNGGRRFWMIFDESGIVVGPDDEYQTRCGTWEEAEAMHRLAVESVKEKFAAALAEMPGA